MDLYRFFDASGNLLYVGISLHAAQRASQHRGEKAWWDDVARMDVEKLDVATRREAETVERGAITRERPLYNAIWNQRPTASPLQPWRCRCGDRVALTKESGFVQLDGWDLWVFMCERCDQYLEDGQIRQTYSRYWVDSNRISTVDHITEWTEHLARKRWFIPGEWTDMLRSQCLIPGAHAAAITALRTRGPRCTA